MFRAQESPDAIAYRFLRDGEEEYLHLTYAQLSRRVAAMAALLNSLERRGARVLILHPAGPDFVTAFFACAFAGMVAVPAYPPRRNRKAARLELMIADAEAAFVMAPAHYEDQVREAAPESLRFIYAEDAQRFDGADLEYLVPPQKDDLAYLQYTSGSTSDPRGVIISHDNLVWTIEDMHRGWRHTADSVIVSWLPVFHDMGLIYGVLAAPFVGVPCVLMHHADFLQRPVRWLRAMHTYRGTHCCAPNFAYALCAARVDEAEIAGLDLSSWRVAVNGSEPVDLQTLTDFSRTFAPAGFRPEAFCPGYGLAEATLKVSATGRDDVPRVLHLRAAALEQNRLELVAPFDPAARAVIGCGRSHVGSEIAVVDPRLQRRLGEDAIGEIWVRGAIVAAGYWQNPAATALQFDVATADNNSTDRGGWMRTGDLGFLNEGELFVTGRIKDLLIVRGRNLYPQDLERCAVRAHAALKADACAAFSVRTDAGEAVCMALEVRRSALRSVTPAELCEAVAAAVAAEFEIRLHDIVLLRPNALPKTSSGKLQRSATRAAWQQGKLTAVDDLMSPPATNGHAKSNGSAAGNGASGAQRNGRDKPEVSPAVTNKKASQNESGEVDEAMILAWMREWIKRELQVEPGADFAAASWQRIGLDSLTTQRLLGDASEHFGVRLSSDAAWEFETPLALTQHLVAPKKDSAAALSGIDLATLRPDDIDRLSDEQVDALLNEFVARGARQ